MRISVFQTNGCCPITPFGNFIKAFRTSPQTPTKFLGSCSCREPQEASENFKQTADFYASLLVQCTHTKSIGKARKIHARMKEEGFPYLTLGVKLIDTYIKCDGIEDADQVFNEMPRRHIIAWNAMISAYVRHQRSKDALRLYERMLTEEATADAITFLSVLKAFSNLGLFRGGQKAHGLLVVLGLEVRDSFVGSALVDMYAKFGRLGEAQLVFGRIVEKDVVLVSAMIAGYAQHGQDYEALKIFKNMVAEGIKANQFSFSSVLISCGNLAELCNGKMIHGVIIKSGFESSIHSQTSLLSMYSKCGLIDDSLKVFHELVNPNLITWTAIVVALVQNSREESALSMLRQMIRNSVKPNEFTLSAVLKACSSLAMLEQGKQVHARIMKTGLDKDRYAGAALVDMYGRCGTFEMARSAFGSLVEFDLVSLNSMIYACAQNGYAHEAVRLFDQMRNLGIELDDLLFINTLSACSNAGLLEEGYRIFSYIAKNPSKEPNVAHYTCMVDLLGRAGRLEEAERLIMQVKNPDVVLWRSLLSACRIHRDVETGKRVANKILELQPQDDGTRILLYNIYASTGNWDEVIKMRTSMREMRCKKDPALSWIEVDRHVHTFMAGDQSHPRAAEIYEELNKLMDRVRRLGYVPDTRFVLQYLDEDDKEKSLSYHSEKLAIAFGLLSSDRPVGRNASIRIFKNLRVVALDYNLKLIAFNNNVELFANNTSLKLSCLSPLAMHIIFLCKLAIVQVILHEREEALGKNQD
ncbi:hypothetical protein ACLOJK_003124 [Asimina triloba]